MTNSFRNKHPDPMSWFVNLGKVVDPKSVMEQYDAMAIWEGVYSEIHTIRKPVLVITGDRDIVSPPQSVSIIADAIARAKLVVDAPCPR